MITDADINILKTVFATKEDLKGFATKDDLQKMESGIRHDMATKDDLKRFATKDDLKRFATKEDVQEIVKESTESIVEGVRIIIDMLGETSKKTEHNTQELQTVRIIQGDHEARIRNLEHASA